MMLPSSAVASGHCDGGGAPRRAMAHGFVHGFVGVHISSAYLNTFDRRVPKDSLDGDPTVALAWWVHTTQEHLERVCNTVVVDVYVAPEQETPTHHLVRARVLNMATEPCMKLGANMMALVVWQAAEQGWDLASVVHDLQATFFIEDRDDADAVRVFWCNPEDFDAATRASSLLRAYDGERALSSCARCAVWRVCKGLPNLLLRDLADEQQKAETALLELARHIAASEVRPGPRRSPRLRKQAPASGPQRA